MIEHDSEIDERDVTFKKGKVNVNSKFGKERENSNKIDTKKQVQTINKECKWDVKERSNNTVGERDEIQFENIKSYIKNIFKRNREYKKKSKWYIGDRAWQRNKWGFKKGKVNVNSKFGKERESSNKTDAKNQVPTINKECKRDLKERSCNLLDERDEIQFEIIKSEIKEYI